MWKGGVCRLGRLCLDMSGEQAVGVVEADGAACAIAGRGDGFCQGCNNSVFICYQIEINSFGMFHSANDAEAVASKRLRVELQTYIHILPSGRAKALTGSLGGIDL